MLNDKRKRFFAGSVILSVLLFSIQFFDSQTVKFYLIAALGVICFFLFWWALREGLKTLISFLILILPVYYSVGIALFWFLLPGSVWVTGALTVIYGISIYILFLTTNVFSVSSIKTIALYRAAKGVGFLLSLAAFFLIMDSVISLRLSYIYVGLLVVVLSFPLYLQGFWVSSLQNKLDKRLLSISLFSALLQSQVSIILFFWPVGVIVGSLFLTIFFYILLGLGQCELEGRLFPQTVREYLMVGVVVFIVMLFSTSWTGY